MALPMPTKKRIITNSRHPPRNRVLLPVRNRRTRRLPCGGAPNAHSLSLNHLGQRDNQRANQPRVANHRDSSPASPHMSTKRPVKRANQKPASTTTKMILSTTPRLKKRSMMRTLSRSSVSNFKSLRWKICMMHLSGNRRLSWSGKHAWRQQKCKITK